MNPPPRNTRFLITAVAFEGGLALLAVAVGWLVGFSPLARLQLTQQSWAHHGMAAVWGLLATLPMLLALLVVERLPLASLRRLNWIVKRLLVPLFAGTSVWDVAIVSLMAGVGEEVLFRGLLQDGLAYAIGPPLGTWVALVAASCAFGLAHAITRAYTVLAALTGVYLGLLFLLTDSLLAPIVAHAAYDFVAIIYLMRTNKSSASPAGDDERKRIQGPDGPRSPGPD